MPCHKENFPIIISPAVTGIWAIAPLVENKDEILQHFSWPEGIMSCVGVIFPQRRMNPTLRLWSQELSENNSMSALQSSHDYP